MTGVVAIHYGTGVLEGEVVREVLRLTQERVNDIRREIAQTVHGLEAINNRFASLTGMTQAEADAEFRNLDTQLQHLLTLRHTLQARVDGHLSQQRIAADVAAQPQTKVA